MTNCISLTVLHLGPFDGRTCIARLSHCGLWTCKEGFHFQSAEPVTQFTVGPVPGAKWKGTQADEEDHGDCGGSGGDDDGDGGDGIDCECDDDDGDDDAGDQICEKQMSDELSARAWGCADSRTLLSVGAP